MSMPLEHIERVRRWVEKAEHDLTTAEHTLTLGENCPFDTVCFHSQQCAEKYLKAFLTFHSIDFPKTHDIVILLRLSDKVEAIGLEPREVQSLNRYTIEARYPGAWEPFLREEAEEALATAKNVRNVIRARLPKETLP